MNEIVKLVLEFLELSGASAIMSGLVVGLHSKTVRTSFHASGKYDRDWQNEGSIQASAFGHDKTDLLTMLRLGLMHPGSVQHGRMPGIFG